MSNHSVDAIERSVVNVPCPPGECSAPGAHVRRLPFSFVALTAGSTASPGSGKLLGRRKALVVVVYKQDLGFQAAELPTVTMGLPSATVDVSTALVIDRAIYEGGQRMAQQSAELAKGAGFEAEGLAVADDLETPVAETLTDLADERNAQRIVVGTHGHGGLSTVILGSTSRDVIRRSTRPVVVVRQP